MKIAVASLITAILNLSLMTICSGQVKEAEIQHALNGVKWADNNVVTGGVLLSDLKGKSVVILVYETDRVQSEWTGAFLTEFKAAVRDKPVVVIAINSDRKAGLDLSFMKENEFTGPNIIHGGSSLLAAQLGLKSSYYSYLLIDPAGTVVHSDNAARYYDSGQLRFDLTRRICQSKTLGAFSLIDVMMSNKLKATLWQYEFGKVPSADELKKILTGLSDKDKTLVDQAIDRYLDADVKKIRALSAGSAEERLAAFDRAKSLFRTFASKPQAEQLKEIGRDLNSVPGFDKELEAKKAYDKALQQSAKAKNPDAIRALLLLSVAKRFKGTVYGRMAATTGKGGDEAKNAIPESLRVWKESSEAENKAALAKQKAFFSALQSKFPDLALRSYETKQFLFYSDLPPQLITATCLPYLDAMYAQLCTGYGLDPKKSIWLGKATIVAFAKESNFQQFELEFYHSTKQGAQGLAHPANNKSVLISCFAGTDAEYFAIVLVHETSHGFNWCYKSAEVLPNWLNEGSAEWIAHHVVTGDKSLDRKFKKAFKIMADSRSLGGNFFSAENIDAWQYGAAASMTDFLMNYEPEDHSKKSAKAAKNKPTRFRTLVDDIKSGMPWEDSLLKAYNLTPVQLAQLYGQSIGIPDLKP